MSLKNKFRIMEAVAAAGLLTLAGFWIQREYDRILHDKEEKVQHLVDVPYSILIQEQQLEAAGKLSHEQAQRRALEIIGAMRYDGSNYFWVNDMHPTMVMHPLKPELNGHDLSTFKDPRGKALFVEMAEAVRSQGSGFVSYMWPKPGRADGAPQPKISFVRGFAPWGWILGTGIYIDDVAAAWHKDMEVAAEVAGVCLILLLTFTRSVSRFVLTTLSQMLERVSDIGEGQGDLTKRIPAGGQDELGELARAFNIFLEKLHRLIGEVAGDTRQLAESSGAMSETASLQARESENQREQTQHVAASVKEMDTAVEQVSQNSSEAAGAAREAAAIAHEGGSVLKKTQEQVRSASVTLGNAARMVEDLGKRSDQIGKIVETIKGIAEQTNLLALNAAIEAARAGNMGRGFAVVADEVGKLAERTGSSTKEIGAMIQSIQEEIGNVVTAMKAGTQQFEEGIHATERAGESFLRMIQTSQQVEDMISRIATATTEQAACSKGVNVSVSEIARITEVTAHGAQDAKKNAEKNSRLAEHLEGLVGQFQLDSTPEDSVTSPFPATTTLERAKGAAAASSS